MDNFPMFQFCIQYELQSTRNSSSTTHDRVQFSIDIVPGINNEKQAGEKIHRIEYAFYPFCQVEIQGWKFFQGITWPVKNFKTLSLDFSFLSYELTAKDHLNCKMLCFYCYCFFWKKYKVISVVYFTSSSIQMQSRVAIRGTAFVLILVLLSVEALGKLISLSFNSLLKKKMEMKIVPTS